MALLEVFVAWATTQLTEAGYRPKTARTLAVRLLSRCQGAILMAHAYGDPSLLSREVNDIEKWVAAVVAARAG